MTGRLTLLFLGLCALILAPFLVFGEAIEGWLAGLFGEGPAPGTVAALVVALLSLDVVLPLPSSLISAGAGAALGFLPGAAAIFVGMTIGSVVGYALGRRWGMPMVAWAAGGRGLEMPALAGGAMLAVTRAVPVLAEAATVVAGATRVGIWPFLAATGLANLGVALVYGYLGALAADTGSFLMVFAAAIAVPIAGYLLFRLTGGCLPRKRPGAQRSR